ncbi:MAG: hypothetical protein U1F57_10125 [bacterium]
MMKETKLQKPAGFSPPSSPCGCCCSTGLSFHSHKIEAKSAADHVLACQTGQQVRSGGVASPVSFRLPASFWNIRFLFYFYACRRSSAGQAFPGAA